VAANEIDFFFDPICPWAWITSRFAVEVAEQRPLQVEWRFICLRMVNAARDYDQEFPPGYVNAHTAGQRMLRVAAAARGHGGNEAVGRLYAELGERLHTQGRSRTEVREANLSLLPEAVAAAGLPSSLLEAAEDEGFDAVLDIETNLALARAGKDVGTPIITFAPGTAAEASFFGPVISRIPRGAEAVEIWAAVERLATTPGLAELKRSIREAPDFS
jgi:hypothetical protein